MKKSVKTVYIVATLMLATAVIYFLAASQEIAEASGEAKENEAGDDLSTTLQTSLFVASGIGYMPVGLWMVKSKDGRRTPYIMAIVGSLLLIGLYIASRTVSLPVVGLQSDIGFIDVLAKVLQTGIVAGATYVLVSGRSLTKRNLNSLS